MSENNFNFSLGRNNKPLVQKVYGIRTPNLGEITNTENKPKTDTDNKVTIARMVYGIPTPIDDDPVLILDEPVDFEEETPIARMVYGILTPEVIPDEPETKTPNPNKSDTPLVRKVYGILTPDILTDKPEAEEPNVSETEEIAIARMVYGIPTPNGLHIGQPVPDETKDIVKNNTTEEKKEPEGLHKEQPADKTLIKKNKIFNPHKSHFQELIERFLKKNVDNEDK